MKRSWPTKEHGVNISGALLHSEENFLVSSPRSIRVPSHSQIDAVSETSGRSGGQPQESTDVPSTVDDAEASHEGAYAEIAWPACCLMCQCNVCGLSSLMTTGRATELQAFIHEAFASEASQQEIRKANILANKKLGTSASLGWAMEGVLKDIGMSRSSKPSTPASPPPRSAHSSSRQSPARLR